MLGNEMGDVEFNMTTSGDLALVAISRMEPVGIDCERIRERQNLTGIAKRMFTPEEASRVANAPKRDRSMRFHLAWTSLEAGVKADGRGLAHRRDSPAQGRLDVAHCIPEQGFIAAVARRNLPPPAQWMTLELDHP